MYTKGMHKITGSNPVCNFFDSRNSLYVLVCTGTYQEFLDSKKLQTGFEPVILCIPLHTLPLDCGCTANEFQVSIYPNVGVYIKLVLFMSLYLALDDEWTAPDPLHRPHRPRRPQRGLGSGLEPHDGPTQHCDRLGHVRCAAGRPRDSETGRNLKVGRFECGSGHGSV